MRQVGWAVSCPPVGCAGVRALGLAVRGARLRRPARRVPVPCELAHHEHQRVARLLQRHRVPGTTNGWQADEQSPGH